MTFSRVVYLLLNNRYILRIKRTIRRKYWTWIVRNQCHSAGVDLNVNNRSSVTQNTIIGSHVNFNGIRITGDGRVTIGDWFHSGKDCSIITHIHNYDKGDAIPYDDTYFNKDAIIGDCVWIGDGVNILGGVKIGEGAIIQAYSTVVNDIPKGGIAGGHPAKVFKNRDMIHYEKLKSEKKFH